MSVSVQILPNNVLDGSLAHLTFYSKEFEGSGQLLTSKTLAFHLHWFTVGFPAFAPAFHHQLGVFGPHSLTCLLNSDFPGTTYFVDSDVNIMSGWSAVAEMCSGNLSCLPRSTWSFQSRAVVRSPLEEFGCCCAFSPALTKVMDCLVVCWYLLLVVAMLTVSARALRT